jgi:hypothetical protein
LHKHTTKEAAPIITTTSHRVARNSHRVATIMTKNKKVNRLQ